jgi:hypothetical protein
VKLVVAIASKGVKYVPGSALRMNPDNWRFAVKVAKNEGQNGLRGL